MIGRSFSGSNKCFVCGKTLNWTKTEEVGPGRVVAYAIPEVPAEVFAISANDDGSVKFEIQCRCPQCRTTNKFYEDFTV